MIKLKVASKHKSEMINITNEVSEVIINSGISSGLCNIFTPHSTASIFVFENADPKLQRDFLKDIKRLFPKDASYTHSGGNADAHIKSAIMGASITLPIMEAKMMLGEWQGIFLADFDGPREREVIVTVING